MYDFVIYLCGHGETKDLTSWCLCNLYQKTKYRLDIRWLTGDALIGRARSIVCTKFLKRTDSPYMIFIDTDQVFTPEDIDKIYEAMLEGHEVIAGAYSVDGGKFLAVTGYGDMNFDGGIIEAQYVSTGFMGISRKAIIQIKDNLNLQLLHEGKWCECYSFFESGELKEEKIYISEDWDFCNKVRKAGMKVYLHTGVLLGHLKDRNIPASEGLKGMLKSGNGKSPQIAEEFVIQSTLPADLAEYAGISEQEVKAKMSNNPAKIVADEWRNWKGGALDFYKENESYIFDLANFNYRPEYWSGGVAPIMKDKNKSILDIGCGIGSVALYLARHRNRVVGYDPSSYLIDFCNFRKDKFGLGLVDFTTELPDVSQFDLVLAINTLEHIEDLGGFLMELGGSMKSEVRFYHTDDFKSSKEIWPMHFDHSESIDKWLSDAGFIVFDERWAIKK